MYDESAKLARRRLRLPELELDILTCSGVRPQVADELLKLRTTGTNNTKLEDEIPVRNINPETVTIM